MSGKRYPEEFKIEAVKQVTDRGYRVGEVARRLGVTAKSMHEWIKRYGDSGGQHQAITAQQSVSLQMICKLHLRQLLDLKGVESLAAVGVPLNIGPMVC